MVNTTALLQSLEAFDTLHGEDALSRALGQTLGDETLPGSGADAVLHLWGGFMNTPQGTALWSAWSGWADERLRYWHSIKVAAVTSAWNADPDGKDIESMRRRVVTDLRQGINDNPVLLADMHFLAGLSRQRHSFSFTQALRDIREGGLDIKEDRLMGTHCALAAHAFAFVV